MKNDLNRNKNNNKARSNHCNHHITEPAGSLARKQKEGRKGKGKLKRGVRGAKVDEDRIGQRIPLVKGA
jgi:hypothetical protein